MTEPRRRRETYALSGDAWKYVVLASGALVLFAPRIAVAAERFVSRRIDAYEWKLDQAAGDR